MLYDPQKQLQAKYDKTDIYKYKYYQKSITAKTYLLNLIVCFVTQFCDLSERRI